MAGLNLGAGAQVRVGSQASYGTLPDPTTSLQAGFGLGGTTSGAEGIGALSPNDAAGVSFWWGVLATAALVGLYWSLPN